MGMWRILKSKVTLVKTRSRRVFVGNGCFKIYGKMVCVRPFKTGPHFLAV